MIKTSRKNNSINNKKTKNVKHYSRNNKSNKSNKMRGSGNKSMITKMSDLFSFTKPINDEDLKHTHSISITDGVMKVGDKKKILKRESLVDEILKALDKSKKTLLQFGIYNTTSEKNKISEQDLIFIIGALLKNEKITNITICDYHIDIRVAQALSAFLKVNDTLTSLTLNNNKMNGDGVIDIVEGLKQNNTLKILDIGTNNIGDNGIVALSEALNGTNITQLIIDNCKLDSNEKGQNYGIETLSKILKTNTKLEMLSISNNNIGCYNILNLLSSLENHLKLYSLDISNTNMTKKCKDENLPIAIGEAISQIKNLNIINMADNNIGNNGISKIFSSLLTNSNNISHMIISNNNLGNFKDYEYNDKYSGILLDTIIANCVFNTLMIDKNPFTEDDKNIINIALENQFTITDMGESVNKDIRNLLIRNKNIEQKLFEKLDPMEKLAYDMYQNKLVKQLSDELKLLRQEQKSQNTVSVNSNSNSNNNNNNHKRH